MNGWNLFLWVIYPYIMLTVFVAGHVYRYKTEQLTWTAKSSEFLEKKQLRAGSLLFHYGILLVFIGHVIGLLVPKTWLNGLGISDSVYHAGAVYGGGLAGLMTLSGITLLLFRRTKVRRVRVTSSFTDLLVAVILFLIVGIGLLDTLGYNLAMGEFDYRSTIAPWLRGLLAFHPDPFLMQHVPLLYQIHVLLAFSLFGLWPFTRLVHVWSVPLSYLKRSPIVYRSQDFQLSASPRRRAQ